MSVAVINFYARNQVGMKSGDETKKESRDVLKGAHKFHAQFKIPIKT